MVVSNVNSIRELDRITIASGTPGHALMERAGEGLAEAAREMLKGIPSPRVLVVCGKGNNGGDGFVAARLLLCSGIRTVTLLLFEKSAYSGDALLNLRRLEKSFAKTLDGTAAKNWPDFKTYPLIIDAIFGTGFSGPIKGLASDCIERINVSGARILAADTPSGINSDTGEVPGTAIMADVTVAMGLPKLGQLFYPARAHVGDLRVKDLGFASGDMTRLCGKARLIIRETAKAGIRVRRGDEHKNNCGRVLVVAGSTGLTGAACLTARAAMKSGAGIVTLCVPKSLNAIFEIKLTEEMTHPLEDNNRGYLLASHEKPVLALLKSHDVLCLGPGLGREKSTQALIRALVRKSPVPVILDADGINAFQGRPELLRERESPLLLTPHEGELKRLTGQKQVPLNADDRLEFVRGIQKKLAAGILLKGPSTLVSFSNGEVYINTTGNPGMATAGAGDVLTGLIGGFFAQTRDLLRATLTAVYLHGLSGDAAAIEQTENALLAGDIIACLPHALKETLS